MYEVTRYDWLMYPRFRFLFAEARTPGLSPVQRANSRHPLLNLHQTVPVPVPVPVCGNDLACK